MRLGAVIADWRWANLVDIREAAKLLDVSHATLSRLESGKNCDARTLAKIMVWLFEPDQTLKRRAKR